eukprot:g62500.t1
MSLQSRPDAWFWTWFEVFDLVCTSVLVCYGHHKPKIKILCGFADKICFQDFKPGQRERRKVLDGDISYESLEPSPCCRKSLSRVVQRSRKAAVRSGLQLRHRKLFRYFKWHSGCDGLRDRWLPSLSQYRGLWSVCKYDISAYY